MLIKESGEMEMITIGDNDNNKKQNPSEKSSGEKNFCCGKYFYGFAYTNHQFEAHHIGNRDGSFTSLEYDKLIE